MVRPEGVGGGMGTPPTRCLGHHDPGPAAPRRAGFSTWSPASVSASPSCPGGSWTNGLNKHTWLAPSLLTVNPPNPPRGAIWGGAVSATAALLYGGRAPSRSPSDWACNLVDSWIEHLDNVVLRMPSPLLVPQQGQPLWSTSIDHFETETFGTCLWPALGGTRQVQPCLPLSSGDRSQRCTYLAVTVANLVRAQEDQCPPDWPVAGGRTLPPLGGLLADSVHNTPATPLPQGAQPGDLSATCPPMVDGAAEGSQPTIWLSPTHSEACTLTDQPSPQWVQPGGGLSVGRLSSIDESVPLNFRVLPPPARGSTALWTRHLHGTILEGLCGALAMPAQHPSRLVCSATITWRTAAAGHCSPRAARLSPILVPLAGSSAQGRAETKRGASPG